MHKGGLPLCERTMLVDWVRPNAIVVELSVIFEKEADFTSRSAVAFD